MGGVCGEGGAFGDEEGGLGIDGAEEGDAAAGLVLVEELGELEAGYVGFDSLGDVGGCGGCHAGWGLIGRRVGARFCVRRCRMVLGFEVDGVVEVGGGGKRWEGTGE